MRRERRLIGRTVGDLMARDVVTVRRDWPRSRAIVLLEAAGVNRLPVLDDDGVPVGIPTRGDVIAALARAFSAVTPRPRRRRQRPSGSRGRTVRATVRNRLIVSSRHVGEHPREAEILEVRGPDGSPPYLVRWSGDKETALVFPGPDSAVRHVPRRRMRGAEMR
jgi:CBS domain-containing protein